MTRTDRQEFYCDFCEISVNACNFTKTRLRDGCLLWTFQRFSDFCDVLQEFSKSWQKYWWKNVCKISLSRWLFCKNNSINCDDNDDATCFLIPGRLLLLDNPWNEISLEVLELSICVAARLLYLDQVLIYKKTEDEPAYFPGRYKLLQIVETIQKFSLFPKDGAIV